MVDYERIRTFLASFLQDAPEDPINQLYSEARKQGLPVIRPETRALIETCIRAKQPVRALEIGTAIGYSAIVTLNSMGEGARLTGMELDPARAEAARENLARFGYGEVSEVLCGDAAELLPTLPNATYDYIFVDAAKGQYMAYLPEVLRVAVPGAMILSDNILQDYTVMDSRFMVERRDRTIHARIREYLYALTHDERLTTSILPVGDGVAMTVVKKD